MQVTTIFHLLFKRMLLYLTSILKDNFETYCFQKVVNKQNIQIKHGICIQKNKYLVLPSLQGSQYSIWQLSDLRDCTKSVGFFLFASAHTALWKMTVGTVLGILNSQIMKVCQQFFINHYVYLKKTCFGKIVLSKKCRYFIQFTPLLLFSEHYQKHVFVRYHSSFIYAEYHYQCFLEGSASGQNKNTFSVPLDKVQQLRTTGAPEN